jgi:esterase/lipase superfamily enzyme
MSTLTSFKNSYIITARSSPSSTYYANIAPLPNNELWFYTAPNQYEPDASNYTPVGHASQTPPQAFLDSLTADLKTAAANGCPQLAMIVHGLGTLFTDAVAEMTMLGSGLQQYANYGGLVISFDWPSYGEWDSSKYYSSSPYSFPPTGGSGTVRDNINGTVGAFGNLLTMLQQIQSSLGVQINVICHSEGNYLLMLAMAAETSGEQPVFNQALLVAADINNGAFQQSDSVAEAGQGLPISKLSNRVTIYYSKNDDVLPYSQSFFKQFHNPLYPDRLGLGGPHSYDTGALPTNTWGVDCSKVISESVIINLPQVPPGTSSHSAYFYVPQVLTDWAATLMGTAEESVANRVANANAQDQQGFIMQHRPAPAIRLAR